MTTVDDLARRLQVLNPAQLWLRFYGRFLFVKPKSGLIVLAVNACRDATSKGSAGNPAPEQSSKTNHQVFLTIRQINCESHGIDPSSRLVATEVVPFQGALNVWSIDGSSIEVLGKSALGWPECELIPLADLNELAPDCEVNSRFLDPYQALQDPDSPFTAFIRIHEGSQFSFHLPTKDFGALWEFRAPDGSVCGDPRPLADMVQITMTLPRDDGANLTFKQLPRGVAGTNSPTATISVRPFIEPIVVVSFSNLCSTPTLINQGDYTDREFASFYNIFVKPPDDKKLFLPHLKSFVPAPRQAEAVQGDVSEPFAPFGDCFLGAMIKT